MRLTTAEECTPCPKCGEQPKLIEWNEKRLPPFTLTCHCRGLAGGKTEEAAINNWNDRSWRNDDPH
jgi:hypothetical protein